MKRVLLTFVAVLSAWVSMAQVTIKHDTVWYKGFPKDNAMHSLKDTIVNNTASTVTVSWSKSADQILTGWSVLGLCDPAACYLNSNDPTV
ncbi:MAG: hypothetical protein HWD58_11865 [Bacteroidota bacterium]|nr:MAG: hypothetical protein HWD58_11865 [Bacteroidota bacterium]